MIEAWSLSDAGLIRRENQDSFLVVNEPGQPWFAIVCDGMGGVAGGKAASRIACEVFGGALRAQSRGGAPAEAVKKICITGLQEANRAVREAAQEIGCDGMGTTLVAACECREGAVLCNIGDSRAYLINSEGIVRLTRDHSYVEKLLSRGEITAEEARRHPNRNLITRALGPDNEAQCDLYVTALEEGDMLLLCTDGLVNTVEDQEMLFEALYGGDLKTCPERLIEIAKSRGAPDNVTVVLLYHAKERGEDHA